MNAAGSFSRKIGEERSRRSTACLSCAPGRIRTCETCFRRTADPPCMAVTCTFSWQSRGVLRQQRFYVAVVRSHRRSPRFEIRSSSAARVRRSVGVGRYGAVHAAGGEVGQQLFTPGVEGAGQAEQPAQRALPSSGTGQGCGHPQPSACLRIERSLPVRTGGAAMTKIPVLRHRDLARRPARLAERRAHRGSGHRGSGHRRA